MSAGLTQLIRLLALMMLIKNLGRHSTRRNGGSRSWLLGFLIRLLVIIEGPAIFLCVMCGAPSSHYCCNSGELQARARTENFSELQSHT
jgi:hypothetical protein